MESMDKYRTTGQANPHDLIGKNIADNTESDLHDFLCNANHGFDMDNSIDRQIRSIIFYMEDPGLSLDNLKYRR